MAAAVGAIRSIAIRNRVRQDVIEGYVTLDHARADYGVVLNPKDNTIDQAATGKLRTEKARRSRRLKKCRPRWAAHPGGAARMRGGRMRSERFIGGRAAAAAIVVFGMLALGGHLADAQAPQHADALRVGKGFRRSFSSRHSMSASPKASSKSTGSTSKPRPSPGDAKLQQAFAAGAIDLGTGSGPGMAFIAKGSPTFGCRRGSGATAGHYAVLAGGRADQVARRSQGQDRQHFERRLADRMDGAPRSRRIRAGDRTGIKMVALGDVPAQLSALRTHQVDAVPFDITTAYQLDAKGDVRILLKFGDIVKDYINHVIFASNDVIAKRPRM